ncbi:MAG: DUF2336 domain-containing protein [Proteobacteria bacterium]|nr:DUF2336 domain-containing protein [Pseudomonadota bacterium]
MDWLKGLFKGKGNAGDKALSYEDAKEMASNENLDVRRDLATRTDVTPEILYFLAEDPEPEVRRLIAANRAAPVHADFMLAKDADQEVRGGLAAKIATLTASLSDDDLDKVRLMARETLGILARDQVTRVRQILAETLKDVADAPPDVIRQLSNDAELVVAGPILQFSPVLNEQDLLEIIESSSLAGRLEAISQRANLVETLTEAIAATDDVEAIALMLGNPSAQVREEVLNQIIDRAPDIEPWHEPLVKRPVLPGRAAAKLARFVAHSLLQSLEERQDLPADVLEEVRQVVERRLDEEAQETPEKEKTTAEEAHEKVKTLLAAGALEEAVIAKAVKEGDRELTIAGLAELSNISVLVVRTVITNRSAKGMLAIAWKAGLSAKLAETLQRKLALVGTKELLRADGNDYPLSDEDMEWQLNFIKDMA